MAPAIFNKLRRRQSSSLPLRTQHPQSIVHHASTPPDWPTQAAQATPDVYITSPPEDDGDGLLTSVCVHRGVEHEPKKKLRRQDDHPPATSLDASETSVEGPPAFRRSSLHTPDVVLPKKPSELARETAKWAQILNRQPATNKEDLVESPVAVPGAEAPAAGNVQWEGGHALARVSSTREHVDALPALPVPKAKATLRHRASKVFKNFANRESLVFGSSTADKRANGQQQPKRRNTLSNDSRPVQFDTRAAAAGHAQDGSSSQAPAAGKTSGEGRRRSATLSQVESAHRSTSPPLPSLPTSDEGAPSAVSDSTAANKIVPALEPPAELVEAATQSPAESASDAPKTGKLKKLQSKNSKKLSQTPASTSPASAMATPKSSKSKGFLRHRRRATISSMSQSQLPADVTGPRPSAPTVPQADTPKTPSSLRSRPFSIVDLRKGFNMRSFGKGKGKLFSAKSSPATGSPPPPVPILSAEAEAREPPATVMQRYKMSRPPPLQPSDSSPQIETSSADLNASPTTVEFDEAGRPTGESLPSPTESEGPITPMSGALAGSIPVLSLGLALAPAIELNDRKKSEENVPELSFTPPASDESEQGTQRTSAASEATTIAVGDPLFSAFDAPSSLGSLQLQLSEPTTKTGVIDAHLRLDSLRFDNFSFDTDGF